jgi:hypothetical protein
MSQVPVIIDDMAKIRDIAKITPLKQVPLPTFTTKDNMTTTTTPRTRGNANNAGFKQWLADRHDQQLSFQDIILVALEEIEQPVSTQEVQHYIKIEGGLDVKDYRVKYALDQLVQAGKASVHLEDETERKLRANGVPVTPKPAYLFNSGRLARRRTVAVVVDGYSIFDPRSLAGKPKVRKTKLKPVDVTKPIGAPAIDRTSDQGSAIDYLIEKIVAERTKDLRAQLDEANAKLAQFKKLLS